jgi:RNA polymerase sigma-70 factor, ECF subfamily
LSVAASDIALVERLQNGDQTSFETLFREHYGMVVGVLVRYSGTREEAEDLAQEVFIRLYRHLPVAGSGFIVSAWLYRVATNLGHNSLRSKRRADEKLIRAGTLAANESSVSTVHDPEASAISSENRDAVRCAIGKLPARHQACLVLRQSGLSYAEIAQVVGVAPGSVGSLLTRAEREFAQVFLADAAERPASVAKTLGGEGRP